jgi:hypothetical protein
MIRAHVDRGRVGFRGGLGDRWGGVDRWERCAFSHGVTFGWQDRAVSLV